MNDKFFLIIFVLFLYFYQRRRQSLQYIYEFNNGMLYLRGKSKIYEIMSKKKYRKFYQYYICGLKDLNVYYIIIVQIKKNKKNDKKSKFKITKMYYKGTIQGKNGIYLLK